MNYWADKTDLQELEWTNGISWTGRTLNSIVGCSKVSRACKHCYAMSTVGRGLHDRWAGATETRSGKLLWTGQVNYLPEVLSERPKAWRRPALVFFTSLSDPFHSSLTDQQIQEMLDGCAAHPHLLWQWLTKRPERAAELADKLRWPSNMWLGTTVEQSSEAHRADALRAVGDAVQTKFVSAEPLTDDDVGALDLSGIDWLIVGGESGAGAEPMHIDWARSLRDRALAAEVPLFFKQWGRFGPTGTRRKPDDDNTYLDGVEWMQFPRAALDHQERWAPVMAAKRAAAARERRAATAAARKAAKGAV